MIPYPDIDPTIVRIGPLSVRWYGLMYLLGFLAGYVLVRKQIKEEGAGDIETEYKHLDGLLLSVVLGLVIGARFGYVVFYNLPYFLSHPDEILATWHGGMSFHGGAIGALLGGLIYTKRHKLDFWHWADRFIVTAPVGLGLGRIGNFINGELVGRISDVPWAMVFPGEGPMPRHPSQLYEALFEGLLLFLILWPLRKRPWPRGCKLALFLMLYGIFRFVIEFFREPDPQLGFVMWGWVTMGQVLCFFTVLLGVILWLWCSRHSQAPGKGVPDSSS